MALEKPKFGVVGYTFRDFDKSIDEVARFYGISPFEIMGKNPVGGNKLDWPAFITGVRSGDSLALPIPEDERGLYWDRLEVRRRYTNLRAVCDDANAHPLRTMEPALTPIALLRYVLNAELRVKLEVPIERFSIHWQWPQTYHDKPRIEARFDAELGALPLPDDAIVFIPYKRLPITQWVNVAPGLDPMSLDAASLLRDRSTAKTAPAWVKGLYFDHIEPLFSDVRHLEHANTVCHRARYDAAMWVAQLRGLIRFVDLNAARYVEYGVPERLRSLQNSLEEFLGAAELSVLDNPARIQFPVQDNDRSVYGARVADRLESESFSDSKVFDQLCKENPAVVVCIDLDARSVDTPPHRMRLGDLTSLVVQLAHQELSLAHEAAAERGRRDLEAAVTRMISEANPEALSGGSITQKILSVVGTAASVATVSFGDLPGPRSLSVAVVTMLAAYDLNRAPTLSSVQRNAVRERLTRAIERSTGWDKDLRAKYRRILAPDLEAPNRMDAIRELDPDGKVRREIVRDLTSRVQCSFRWNAGMLLLNVFGLINTIAGHDDERGRYYTNITNGIIGTSLSLAQMARSSELVETIAELDPALARRASKVLTGLGVIATILTIVSGSYTAAEGLRKKNGWLAAAGFQEALGGASILFGYACSIVGFEVIGGALLVGAIIIKALIGDHANKQLVTDALKELGFNTKEFGLEPLYNAAMECADLCRDYRGISDTPENRAALAEIGFRDRQVLDIILTRDAHPSQFHPPPPSPVPPPGEGDASP